MAAISGEGGDVALWVDATDASALGVCNEQIAVGHGKDTARAEERGFRGGAIAPDAIAISSEGGDVAAFVDFSDAMVACVGDEEIAVGVEGESVGCAELCICAESVFVGGCSVASEGGDVAVCVDLSDAMVVFVGDVEVSVGVKGESAGGGESGLLASAVGESFGVGSSEGGDVTVFFDLSDAVVAFVGNIEVVLCIDSDGAWGIEGGVEFAVGIPAAIVSAPFEEIALGADDKDPVGLDIRDKKAAKAIDGDGSRAQELFVGSVVDLAVERGGCAVGGDFSDGVVCAVSNVEIAVAVEGDLGGVVELGIAAGAILPTASIACERDGAPVRSDFSDGVVARIGDVEITAPIKDDALRRPKLRGKCNTIDPALDTAPCEGGDLTVGKCQTAQQVISAIGGDQEAHIGGERDPAKVLKFGLCQRAVFASKGKGGKGADGSIGGDPSQEMAIGWVGVAVLRDKKLAILRKRQIKRVKKGGFGSLSVGSTDQHTSRKKASGPFGRDFADAMVSVVCHIEIFLCVKRQGCGVCESCACACCVGFPCGATRKKAELSVLIEFVDAVRAGAGDVQHAFIVIIGHA